MTNPVFNQNGFRFYDDGSGWNDRELENVDHSIVDGTNVILRIEIEVTNSKTANNWLGTLYAQKNGAGGYTQMTTTRTDGCRIVASGWFTDADADNVDRLTSSSLTFTGGELDSDGNLGEVAGGMDFAGTDHWEVGICIEIDLANAVSGDYWDFEIRDDVGAQLDGYTRRPRFTYARRIFITHV